MLIDLKTLIKKYDMDIRGVIHIGAYNGNEYDVYKNLGIKEMAFFEPQMDIFKELKRKVGMFAWNYALGNFNGKTKMYVASNGQSSTLLEPKEHLNQYPGITFNKEIEVNVITLDDIAIHNNFHFMSGAYNLINMDTEGYELEVLKGATETLKYIDYIYIEVAQIELQKGRAMVWEVDEFLKDFDRVETQWTDRGWGDALYIRK